MQEMVTDITDVLIIGGGIAGASAALEAADHDLNVTILCNSDKLVESASYYAQGGIIYRHPEDNEELWIKDFQLAGDGICWEQAIKHLFRYGKEIVDQVLIERLKIDFDRDSRGQIHLIKEGVHSYPRIIHIQDHTGRAIQLGFVEELERHPNISILYNTTAVDLITLSHHSLNSQDIYEPPTCCGAYVYFQRSDQVEPIMAKETILATGGLGQLYLHTSNPRFARGDGYAMAYRAGARIMNMEYVQFHPTTLYTRTGERFLLTEALRGAGAELVNSQGYPFMKDYHELGSLAPRDVVARSILKEMIKTGSDCVYLDISFKDRKWLEEHFPLIMAKCQEYRIDPAVEPIPVVPAAHYECGGVYVDLKGQTTLRRLRAIGEVSCTGIHGANRIPSSSLLEGLVWGVLTARDVVKNIRENRLKIPRVAPWKAEHEPVDPDLIHQDWTTIKQTMWNYVGLVRTSKKLKRAFSILQELQIEIERFYAHARLNDSLVGLRNGILTAWTILHAARLNRKSRGCHFRLD